VGDDDSSQDSRPRIDKASAQKKKNNKKQREKKFDPEFSKTV